MRAEKSQMIKEIRNEVSNSLDFERELPDEELKEFIREIVLQNFRNAAITIPEKLDLVDTVYNSIRGFDILQPFINDPQVTEIMVNGYSNIFIERGGRIEKQDLAFESTEKLCDVIQSMVSRSNRSVNEANPIVDFRLSDGSRVNVVLEPAAINGPIVTIRKFPKKPMTMDQLVKSGALTEEASWVLSQLVRSKYNIFISGGTSSGKTTLLNALSEFIHPDERVVTIEDSAELQIRGIDNIVRLETRNPNTEGKGRISIKDLIRTSLRMRPERIIVGEVRGEEALDMLQAMNTGHDGSLSTGHANSPRDMVSRLETMVLSAAPLPIEVIRKQIASAIDIIVHLSRLRDKNRRLTDIIEISGFQKGEIQFNQLFTFIENEGSSETKVNGKLIRTGNLLVKRDKLVAAGIKDVL